MQSAQVQLHARIEDHHWWFVGRRRIMRGLVQAIAPPDPDSTVLDIGCGTGANIGVLAGAYRAIGIDRSQEAIEHARRRFPQASFLAQDAAVTLATLACPPRVVLLMDILEHIADDSAFLGHVIAAVPPGTHLLLTVPAEMALWSAHDVSFGHCRRYTRQTLARTWAGLPVEVRLHSAYNTRLYPLVRALRAATRATGKPLGAAGTDFFLPSPPLNAALTALLAGEVKRLQHAIDHPSSAARRGVSLVAILRRSEGAVSATSASAVGAVEPAWQAGA